MFAGYKTYIMAGVAVLSAVAMYFTGDSDLATAAQTAFAALMAAFLRNGMKTGA